MEGDGLQFGERSPDCGAISLDVKLAFSRLCELIDTLKDDIGLEAASFQLQRIRNDAASILKKKRDKILAKERGYQHMNELNSTNASLARLKGVDLQFPVSQQKESSKPFLQTEEEGASFISNHGTLCTSFSSTFRPVLNNKSIKDPHHSVQLGTIVEERRFEVDVTDSEEHDDSEVVEEESIYFFLKSWTLIKSCNDLLISGDKMNAKGEILRKGFISKKVISRKDQDTIQTEEGEFVLMGLLTDKKKLIPIEVKKYFKEDIKFPRNWRMVLKLWIDLEKKKEKEEKEVKKIIPPKKNSTDNKLKHKKTPEINQKSNVKKNISVGSHHDADKNKHKKTPEINQKSNVKKNISVGSHHDADKNKHKKTQEKNQKSNVKKNISVSSHHDADKNTKIEKNKGEKKSVQKKNNRNSYEKSCTQDKGENIKRLGSDDVQEDPGPFSELLGDESLFVLPKSSLTPNQLLGSIKRNVIKGRYTPPTNMFDNVYGNKSDNNSSVNTSFDDIGVKNDPVVKRMSKVKVNNKTNNRKNNNKHQKCIVEDNETVNEILRAAKSKTNTTPSVIRQVFSAEKAEESVNFSDLSDID